MTDENKTVTPVALSKIQKWTWARCRHPSSKGDLSNWDALAALDHFGIPYLYFSNGDPENNVPPGLLERSGPRLETDSVFQPENTIFVFLKFGDKRFLVVDGGGGDGAPFAMASARFFDFGS